MPAAQQRPAYARSLGLAGGRCLAHTAWHEESGALGVFDVWESPEAFELFGEKLMPIISEVGITPAEPHVVPLHNFVAS